ncbi:glutamate-cysteine ligase family protein [Marichromatium gracile]|uniref:glutamate-cysteine ligase family protein n=1 Tax=Marichromatium gracile TaxID=1048 RepID=UPI001F3FD936|nr:glutamate-cysteine ligase family protein [Marichromatium gracile]MCF1184853.1 glutamate-cysteine ligase family protein [Marichromatium gracile]
MGQEIASDRFSEADLARFTTRLREETALLARWFAEGRIARAPPMLGFELEAWLVDTAMRPAPRAPALLDALADPRVVPELSVFNIEFNGTPLELGATTLSRLATTLGEPLERAQRLGEELGLRVVTIGTLPTIDAEQLDIETMSPLARYRALNARIFALRQGRALSLIIDGDEPLELHWHDVMLEAAGTSFQIHLQVAPEHAARVYNASKILSGPLVAISANSPFLFGHALWEETRIALFEQAVSVGGAILQERVNFGQRYAAHSILETFEANLARYPVLLPQCSDEPPEALAHLRLHNGTIWRWNRPLIGFDDDGRPHLRIEHRVIPAGPTVADAIANTALYLGAVHALSHDPRAPEQRLPFPLAMAGFYDCARAGLGARIRWLDGREHQVATILRDDLLPRAHRGLEALGMGADERRHWLDIIAQRLARRRTGAAWQRAWVARHGHDMHGLTAAYLARQRAGHPVHQWSID